MVLIIKRHIAATDATARAHGSAADAPEDGAPEDAPLGPPAPVAPSRAAVPSCCCV